MPNDTFTLPIGPNLGDLGAIIDLGTSEGSEDWQFDLRAGLKQGDVVGLLASSNGTDFNPILLPAPDNGPAVPIQLSKPRARGIINQRARYVRTVRVQAATGSTLTECGLMTARIPADLDDWVQGGNAFGAKGVLGTTDAFHMTFIAENKVFLDSDGVTTFIGSAEPNSFVEIHGEGTGGVQIETTNNGDIEAIADGSGSMIVDSGTTGVCHFGDGLGGGPGKAGFYGMYGGISQTFVQAGSNGLVLRALAGDISMTPGAATGVHLPPRAVGAGNTTPIRFFELAASGANFVGFRAPDSIAADVTWTLPAADATIANQSLTSNAAGVLSWRGAVNVHASTTNAQSITDGAAAAAVTTWTEVTDTANAFTAATGVFAPPVNGFYVVTAEVEFAAIASIVAGEFTVGIYKNGAAQAVGVEVCQVAAANVKRNPKVSLGLALLTTDTLDIRVSQNSGSGGNALTAVGARNVLSIAQVA